MRLHSIGCVVLVFVLTGPTHAWPDLVYNLANDWSDSANANGVWRYRRGNIDITNHESNWAPGYFDIPQPAWVTAPSGSGHIPSWYRSVNNSLSADATYDVPVGRVATHTTDSANGDDLTPSNILWTSVAEGRATISGGVWQARKSQGRSNDWALYVNGTPITGGSVSSADSFNSANRFLFQNGWGGAGALSFTVGVGDTVMFLAQRNSTFGDFVGVDLTINVHSRPRLQGFHDLADPLGDVAWSIGPRVPTIFPRAPVRSILPFNEHGRTASRRASHSVLPAVSMHSSTAFPLSIKSSVSR